MLVLFVYYIKRPVLFYIGYCNILRCSLEPGWLMKASHFPIQTTITICLHFHCLFVDCII